MIEKKNQVESEQKADECLDPDAMYKELVQWSKLHGAARKDQWNVVQSGLSSTQQAYTYLVLSTKSGVSSKWFLAFAKYLRKTIKGHDTLLTDVLQVCDADSADYYADVLINKYFVDVRPDAVLRICVERKLTDVLQLVSGLDEFEPSIKSVHKALDHSIPNPKVFMAVIDLIEANNSSFAHQLHLFPTQEWSSDTYDCRAARVRFLFAFARQSKGKDSLSEIEFKVEP